MKLTCQESLVPGDDLRAEVGALAGRRLGRDRAARRGDGAFAARLPELRRARDAGVPCARCASSPSRFIGDFDADAAPRRSRR